MPDSAAPAWERLEVIGLAATSALLIVGAFVVVEYRRPRQAVTAKAHRGP